MEKRTVLFVDDERDILSSLKRLFRSEPYQTIFAQSGKEALSFLEKERVHVIVTDLNMPEMDGFTLLKQVQKKHPDVIRLVLSAHADKDSVLNAINVGSISRFIIKPWDNEALKTFVRHAIESVRLQEEKKNLLKRIEEHNRQTLEKI